MWLKHVVVEWLQQKRLSHASNELSQSETFLSKQLSATDFYILSRSIISHNKKSILKSLNTQQKKYLHWPETAAYLHSHLTKLLPISHNMNYSQKESDSLKAGSYFSIQPMKFDNPKSSPHAKRFIVCLSTTLNWRKLNISLFLKLRTQVFPVIFLFPVM